MIEPLEGLDDWLAKPYEECFEDDEGDEMTDLEEARLEIKSSLINGEKISCPCCDQLVYLYPRKLNANMCVFLISLYKEHQKHYKEHKELGWIHKSKCRFKGNDYAYLAYFGLAQSYRSVDGNEGSHSGMWQITDVGLCFVEGKIKVASRVFVFNKEIYRIDEHEVDIQEALGNKFSYKELMNGDAFVL